MITLEQPRLRGQETTAARVEALERYLFRLCGQLQAALDELEQQKETK